MASDSPVKNVRLCECASACVCVCVGAWSFGKKSAVAAAQMDGPQGRF